MFLCGIVYALPGSGAPSESAAPLVLPPSPYAILSPRILRPPAIDAFPLCIPPNLDSDLDEIARTAASGRLQDAIKGLESYATQGRALPFGGNLLWSTIVARAADKKGARVTAEKKLHDELIDGGPVGPSVCAHLELARIMILLERFPDAAAQAALARRLSPELARPDKMMEAADFYKAEALYFSNHPVKAKALYKVLAQSKTRRTVAAARLRLTDIEFDAGERAVTRRDYGDLLAGATAFGASEIGWAPRVAESHIAGGDLAEAHSWLRRYLRSMPSADAAAAVGLRFADVLAALGKVDDARIAIENVAAKWSGRPVGVVAALRKIDLDLSRLSPEKKRIELRKHARSGHRGISLYAKTLLGRLLWESGDRYGALDVYARLAYENPRAELVDDVTPDIERLLNEAAENARNDENCAAYVRGLSERRALLARYAETPGPFIRLGECYELLGFPETALDVYRDVTRAFGAKVAREVSLPVARAALASGDVGAARTAARAGVRVGGDRGPHWSLLLGEAELFDGKLKVAAEILGPLVEARQPDGDELRAIASLAKAAARLPRAKAYGDSLAKAIAALPVEARFDRLEQFGEACLLSAETLRRNGDGPAAVSLYGEAVEALPDGARRAEAAYWLGALEDDRGRSIAAWQLAAKMPDAGTWRRLAENELRMVGLRGAVGREAQPPADLSR